MVAKVTKSSQGNYYVYTLAFPDGRVFYVGKGKSAIYGYQVYERMDCHEHDAALPLAKIVRRGLNREKCRAIQSIWANGGEVIKRKVFETDCEKDALIYEWALVYMVYGIHNLTNKDVKSVPQAKSNSAKSVASPPVVIEVKPPIEIVETPNPVKSVRVVKPIMTAQEVGDWLGASRRYILKLALKGELVGERSNSEWHFKRSDVDDYIERRKYQTQKEIQLKQRTR